MKFIFTSIFLFNSLILSSNINQENVNDLKDIFFYPITEITGDLYVFPSAYTIYNVTWEKWGVDFALYANVTWTVTGGTVIESDKHSIKIEWNELPKDYMDGIGKVQVYEDLYGQEAELNISIINTTESISEFCDGVLGTPLIAVDFGSGTNPGTPLGSGKTTYQYNPNCALFPGEYSIVTNSNNCRSFWHNVSQDHTGNANGYFLMVNAGNNRNEIYSAVVNNLISDFRYEFSAWVGNLYKVSGAQKPNIKFEIYDLINGQMIASSGIIDIPETLPNFQWQRIAFMFDIPPTVSDVKIVIINTRREETENVGNDMVIDDIGFAPCYPGIIASFSNSNMVGKSYTCSNGMVNLYSSWPSNIPFSNPVYQWQRSAQSGTMWENILGATSINFVQSENLPGIYHYRMIANDLSNPSQVLVSNELIFYVQKMVVDANTTNLFACNGSTASGNVKGIFQLLYSDPAKAGALTYTYNWSPTTYISYPNSNPAYITLPSPGTPPPVNGAPLPPIEYNYTLTVTSSQYGCTSSNIQTIKVYNPRKVMVPNAFTPDGDGSNDTFYPINIEDYPNSKFSVYNRWGQRVFYSSGPTANDYKWDGKFNGIPQPVEVYVWTVELSGCKNNIYSATYGEGIPKGNVTLLR